MKNALGEPQTLLVLGGTSEIALATAHRLVAARTQRVVLAGRSTEALEVAAKELRAKGAAVDTVAFDATDVESHAKVLGEVFAGEEIDVVLMAFGVLGDQRHDERDPVAAAHVAQVNYVGAVSAGVACAQALRAQGHGSLVVLSSVAGERARRANFIYGSAKAGLDAFAQGLGDSLHGSGVHVMVVRPGFVTTKMTEGMKKAPFSTGPAAVADAIAAGLRNETEVVWVPGILRYVMTVIRHLPRPIFRKLPI